MAWKPAINSASESKAFSTALAIGAVITLEFELHAIVGDFEAGIQHDAMFGAFFVKDGIRIVDVNQNFAALGFGGKLFEQAVRARERQVADLARGFLGATGAHQFVVAPERSVKESRVSRLGCRLPHRRRTRKRRSKEETFFALLHDETDRGILWRNCPESLLAHIIRIAASERQRGADEVGGPGRILTQVTTQTPCG